jgi:hypothetical protein
MGHFVTLTPHPVTVKLGAKGDSHQPLWAVVNVSGYDILDLELGVLFLSNRVVAIVDIDTSMQNQSDFISEWLTAGQFARVVGNANQVPTPQWQKLNIASGVSSQGFLKFIRWRVNLSAAGTVTFFIRGLVRRWGR